MSIMIMIILLHILTTSSLMQVTLKLVDHPEEGVEPVPMQMDGEPWLQELPATIRINLVRERDRERQRQRDRERDRETERQRERLTPTTKNTND